MKCTHGAAVGALDPDAIFYLRSRGVPLEQAKAMLTAAFAREMLDTIPVEPLRTHLETLIAAHLTTPPTPDPIADPARAGACWRHNIDRRRSDRPAMSPAQTTPVELVRTTAMSRSSPAGRPRR